MAPFTAKIQRTTDPGMYRDRDRCRESAFSVRIPALASSNPKAVLAHPHVIQSEKSNYFTTLSNSVVNEPPRLYPSKELISYYDKVSAGAPTMVASVGATVPSQGGLSLGSYSSKTSLSKPPPLIKHQPEGGEGLAGKITEQLSQQVTQVQQQHHTGVDRIDCRSPAICPTSCSIPSSFSSAPNHHHQQQQQLQLRAMPSLHRAPVFHPPTQHALECKEAADREKERDHDRAAYGGRLSPPTLTPIQPVSLASAGNKTLAEQQKPPTLLPELRDVKGHGNTAIVTSVVSAISGKVMASCTDRWRGREMLQERLGSFSTEKGMPVVKPQSAVASVIVRPSSSIKYNNPFGTNKSGAMIHKEFPKGSIYPSHLQGEGFKESGVSRIIQPNSNLSDMSVQYKTTSEHGAQGLGGSGTMNMVCRTNVETDLGYFASAQVENSSHKPASGGCGVSLSAQGEHPEKLGSCSTSPGGSLPPPSPAETPQTSPNLIPTPSSVCVSSQLYSSFVHLKKHRAALAAAQSRSSFSIAPTYVMTGNSSLTMDEVDKTPVHSSLPPPSTSQAALCSIDSSSSSSMSGGTTPSESSPLQNGHISALASASSVQPSNYHKLKKAWLTRHSEEDRNTMACTNLTIAKPEKVTSNVTSTSNTTAMSEMIKPCTVNLSAPTSGEVEMSKDTGSKAERERQLEEKVGGGGGEERKVAPSSRRGNKRTYESGSESGGDDSDASESKVEGRAKRQPKPTYKKKQNDMAKKKGDNEKEEDDVKPNGIFRSAREKTKLKLASSSEYILDIFSGRLNTFVAVRGMKLFSVVDHWSPVLNMSYTTQQCSSFISYYSVQFLFMLPIQRLSHDTNI